MQSRNMHIAPFIPENLKSTLETEQIVSSTTDGQLE